MRITPDTNVLVRVLVEDEPRQAAQAQKALADAALVALTLPALCELVWVLRSSYRLSRTDIALGIRALIAGDNITVDRDGVDAGLAALDAGGDFADAVIARQGMALGADRFLSFDRRAVRLVESQGGSAELLG